MGRAIDLFVTYRFIKLLTTPFEKTDAFKLGIIDENGNRIKDKTTRKPVVVLNTSEPEECQSEAGDINQDGGLNILDIVQLVNIILNI